MSDSETLACAQSLVDDFWQAIMARGVTREEAAMAGFTVWIQTIKDMPPDQRENELSTAEEVARMTIADEAEREKQGRRSHLRLVKND